MIYVFLFLSVCSIVNCIPLPNQQGPPRAQNRQAEIAEQYILLSTAIDANDCTKVDDILQNNPHLLEAKIAYHLTPLLYAVFNAKLAVVKLLINSYQANWQAADGDGHNILFLAICSEDLTVFEYIWTTFPDLRYKPNKDKLTPLEFAVRHGFFKLMQWVLKTQTIENPGKILFQTIYTDDVYMMDLIWNTCESLHDKYACLFNVLVGAYREKAWNILIYLLKRVDARALCYDSMDEGPTSFFNIIKVQDALARRDIELAKWLLLRGAPLLPKALQIAYDIDAEFDQSHPDEAAQAQYILLQSKLYEWHQEFVASQTTDIINARRLPLLIRNLPEVSNALPSLQDLVNISPLFLVSSYLMMVAQKNK